MYRELQTIKQKRDLKDTKTIILWYYILLLIQNISTSAVLKWKNSLKYLFLSWKLKHI